MKIIPELVARSTELIMFLISDNLETCIYSHFSWVECLFFLFLILFFVPRFSYSENSPDVLRSYDKMRSSNGDTCLCVSQFCTLFLKIVARPTSFGKPPSFTN